ncbi:MAG: lactate 2-monooxygenase [Saprospiraceae bacterium]|nr:lactate 2-monooxygenase [Saprospiraceae bacterium]
MDPLMHLKEIYLKGNSGIKPIIPLCYEELESKAKKALPKNSYDYIYTGAGKHIGVSNNQSAFKKYAIRPRMLHGNASLDTSVKIFDTQLQSPFLFAPIGVLELAHPKGDLELAKASRNLQIPMIISNQASYSMEAITDTLQNMDRWFQLYFSKNYEFVESLIQRAEETKCSAIVITVDTTILGWRQMDLQNAFLPFTLGKGIAQYTSDPVFKKLMQQKPSSYNKMAITPALIVNMLGALSRFPGSLLSNLVSKDPIKAIRKFIEIYSKPDLNWNDIRWIKSKTKLPLLIKGILRSDDAKIAMQHGVDGIIVSNHGGRQVDHVISSLDALVEIKSQIPASYPLLLDSGIRTGTDAFIALCLGAKSVLVGRPYVYSLAINGHQGVTECMNNFITELHIMMMLSGVKNLNELSPELLVKN